MIILEERRRFFVLERETPCKTTTGKVKIFISVVSLHILVLNVLS